MLDCRLPRWRASDVRCMFGASPMSRQTAVTMGLLALCVVGCAPAQDATSSEAGPPAIAFDTASSDSNVQLTNQFGQSIRLNDFRGRVVLVTFMYTRCPLPDFCPRLMQNVQGFRQAIAGRPELVPKVHMLAVTLDPVFDTPDVLRMYGETMLGGTAAFDHLDLVTGAPADIGRLATHFGVRYQPSSGQITHTLVTGILGPDGRLVKRFPEMMWNLEEAVGIVEREAARTHSF